MQSITQHLFRFCCSTYHLYTALAASSCCVTWTQLQEHNAI